MGSQRHELLVEKFDCLELLLRVRTTLDCSLRQFHISQVPCDTTMREIIDEIPTERLHKPYTRIFAALQRGKDLEPYVFMDGYYLVALDGTGYFSFSTVLCDY